MAPEGFEDRRRNRKRGAKLLDEATDDGSLDLSKLTDNLDSDDPDERASATWALAGVGRENDRRLLARAAAELLPGVSVQVESDIILRKKMLEELDRLPDDPRPLEP